jgi:hypothetical protein
MTDANALVIRSLSSWLGKALLRNAAAEQYGLRQRGAVGRRRTTARWMGGTSRLGDDDLIRTVAGYGGE